MKLYPQNEVYLFCGNCRRQISLESRFAGLICRGGKLHQSLELVTADSAKKRDELNDLYGNLLGVIGSTLLENSRFVGWMVTELVAFR